MNLVTDMLESSPARTTIGVANMSTLLDVLADCEATCTICADACLAEDSVLELRHCIALDMDCADVCDITARIMTRANGAEIPLMHKMLDTCQEICRLCAEECETHAGHMEHCRICAQSCRQCEQACAEAAEVVAAQD